MGSSLELNQFMETILGQLALSVPCTFSLVLLVVKDHFEVMALYETNHKILPPKIQIPLARSKTLNQLINSSKPLLIEDQNAALKDVRINLLEQYFPETIDLRVGSWLGVPMLVKDQIMGILCMAHSQPGAFSYAQTQLVQSVANQAAVAIENVALYAQTRELAVVNERQHLARELHDSVCQSLYGISLGCHVAIAYLNRSPDKVKETLDYILNLADAGLTEMRAMIFNLRPEMLATEGLVEAIHKQAVAIQIRRGIQAITRLGTEPQVSNDIKEALYRIAIEAMNNAIRHANPMQITIDLITQPGEIKLVIGDDGKGFDPSQTFPGHLGLSSMRERAENVRGTLSIESIPGQGTTIQVCVSTPQDVSNQE
jgi:signal transduction histidine kinase